MSGTAKGHKLKTVKGDTTRPTSDRVKESLFNILAGRLKDADVLDIYAGTGNLGIEALSRGAGTAVFVDKSRECTDIIKDNLVHTKLVEKATVITADVDTALTRLAQSGKQFDLVFADPPYNKNILFDTLNNLVNHDIMKDGGIVVAERDVDDPVPLEAGFLKLYREQKYGGTVLSFYIWEKASNEK
ncbi:MAG: 16S rRNA (guanine(966)-N(2))-methyltransferase RsmD [Clostridiales bacterium]|nr:16S rRNA (guanine(966)-N(2))-methyltransferase RsmD [Eubacteriales bacterium]MDH7565268.1 16S rRNA (guanine(966)-N(2))-methyltransferase RsmD [Clostridiales bacterium]